MELGREAEERREGGREGGVIGTLQIPVYNY